MPQFRIGGFTSASIVYVPETRLTTTNRCENVWKCIASADPRQNTDQRSDV